MPGPTAEDDDWVASQLLDGELAVWARMPRRDRRHGLAAAHSVVAALGDEATRPVIAAALLHDAGKTESGLSGYGRVIARLSGAVAGRDQAEAWSATRGFTRRVGLYLRHPELGAELLELAGSDQLTIAWAREHHQPPEQWTIDQRLATALQAADDC